MRRDPVPTLWATTTSLLLALTAIVATGAPAQEPVNVPGGESAEEPGRCAAPATYNVLGLDDVSADFARLLPLLGASPPRSHAMRRASAERRIPVCTDSAHIVWTRRLAPRPGSDRSARIVGARARTVLNTGYPSGLNDGALWAGRGVSTGFHAGVIVRAGVLSAALAPILVFQENRDVDIFPTGETGRRRFANAFYGGIDLPQRFGEDGFWTVDPGQSYIRLDIGGFAAGFATENVWWGPGRRNSIILSNSGPGFPHVFLGTSGPVDIGIGTLELETIWGRLDESDYFDANEDNDSRQFTALTLSYAPEWVPGLHLGAIRAWHFALEDEGVGVDELFPFFDPLSNQSFVSRDNPSGSTPDNQLTSIFFRWALVESGLEVYGEWAREDQTGGLEDFLEEPDHSQAYLVGLQKIVESRSNLVRLAAEVTHLQERQPDRGARGTPIFYTHGFVRQGHTNRGQPLGAGIGPGSDAQYLAADLFTPSGMSGVFVERIRRDVLAPPALQVREDPLFQFDTEVTVGARQLLFLGPVDLDLGAAYSFRFNRSYLTEDVTNWKLRAGLVWRPGTDATGREGERAEPGGRR